MNFLKLLPIVAGLGLYVLAALNPIYTDEVSYAMMLGRYNLEESKLLFLFPECLATFTRSLHFIFQPAAMFLGQIYQFIDTPIRLRQFGVWVATLNILCLLVILFRCAGNNFRTSASILLLASCLGTFPFLFLIARPEGILFASASFLVLLAVSRTQDFSRSLYRELYHIAAVLWLASLLMFTHPLAFGLLPLVITASWFALQRYWTRAVTLIALGYGYLEAWRFHSASYRCPDQPMIEQFFKGYSGNTLLPTDSSFVPLFLEKFSNMVNVFPYWASLMPLQEYPLGLVPGLSGVSILELRASMFLVALSCLMALLFLSFFTFQAIRKLPTRRTPETVLGIVTLSSLLICSAIQPGKYPYRTSLMVLLLLLAFCLFSADIGESWSDAWKRLSRWFAIVIVAQLSLLIWLYAPNFLERRAPLRIPDQPLSYGLALHSTLSKNISEALKRCQLDPSHASRVVVDEMTYFTFQRSKQPILAFYLYSFFWGSSVERDQKLENWRVSAIFALCENLPEKLSRRTERVGKICCAKM